MMVHALALELVPMSGDAGAVGAAAPQSLEGGLLQRFAAGDEAAIDQLLSLYQEQAFWVAHHVVRNPESARDVVQDACIRLLRHHQRFDEHRSSFRTWFLQIVRNLAIDHLRRARVRPEQEIVERRMPTAEGRPGQGLERAEMRERIRTVVASLPEPYRELLLLREVDGVSPQDIAALTDADPGTTRWRIHQARKLFRKEWQARYGEWQP